MILKLVMIIHNGGYLVNANLVTQSIILCTFINVNTGFVITDKIQQIIKGQLNHVISNLLRLQPAGHRHSAEPRVLTHS